MESSEEIKLSIDFMVEDDKINKDSSNDKPILNVCVLGTTGSGKSATCNTLCNDQEKKKFPECSGPESGTKEI